MKSKHPENPIITVVMQLRSAMANQGKSKEQAIFFAYRGNQVYIQTLCHVLTVMDAAND